MTGAQDRPAWRLLGDAVLEWDGTDIAPGLGKKAIGLVAYLAMSPEGAGRDELAAMLWPLAETPAELARAKHSLRQCLVSVRRAFGDGYAEIFVEQGDRLALRRDALDIDALRLAQNGATAPDDLAALCRGPFLRGLVTRARPFDAWIDETRTRLAGIAGPALERARAEAERSGDRPLADRLARAADLMGLDQAPPAREEPAPEPARRRLPWPGLALLAALAMGLGGVYGLSGDVRDTVDRLIGRQAQSGPPRISVLPLTTISGTADEKALANGITLGVNYALYAISNLYPVTPAPTRSPLDQAALVERARQLGVRYLISGAVGIDGEDVRVDVQCFDASTRALVWTQRFHQKREHSFRLQDDITLQIIKGLRIEVSSTELNRIQFLQDTSNLEAWLAAAKGLSHLIRLTPADIAEARADYQEALRRDPGYVSARRGLAWVAFLSVRLGLAATPDQQDAAIAEARNQLGVVLRARPDDGTSLSLKGAILLLDERYDEAVKAGEAAVKTLPGSADVNAVFAHTLTYVGQPRRALDYIDRAMQLSEIDPPFYRWTKGRALRLDGQYAESVAVLEQGLDEGPRVMVQLVELTASYAAAGRLTEARAMARMIRAAAPGITATRILARPRIRDAATQSKEFEYLSAAGL